MHSEILSDDPRAYLEQGYETVALKPRERWLEITLNVPQKRNSITPRMLDELSYALRSADADVHVHAILLSANGPDFCTGYFIGGGATAEKLGSKGKSIDQDAANMEGLQRQLLTLFDMHKPVVAKVRGRCWAGGTDMVFLCDMVLSSDNATFGFPPVRDIGSPPNPMWVYHLGPQWAKRMLLTGDLLSGADAAKIGLVMKSVPDDVLDREAEGLVARMSNIDYELLAANKRSVNLALELMGARTHQRLAAEIDARSHLSPTPMRVKSGEAADRIALLKKERAEKFGPGLIKVEEPDAYNADTLGRIG